MQSREEQARIKQLTSPYSPQDPPRLPLNFGDFLSLLWRLDTSDTFPARERYYRQCVQALADALGLKTHPICRIIETTLAGEIYAQLPNLPYRSAQLLVDAADRKAAIAQLIDLRADMLRIGTYEETWSGAWPGSGLVDNDLRERVFAVLFTALQGQYSSFGRLLLVVDIVIANLIVGFDEMPEVTLSQLIAQHGYPDPHDNHARDDFTAAASS